MKLLIETGSESHTTSWQKCQAKYVGGLRDGQFLYQNKPTIVSQEWLEQTKHQTVVRTVFELPAGTTFLVDYSSYAGKDQKVYRLDESADVQEIEVGVTRLRTYTLKGRLVLVRDLVADRSSSLKTSQEEGF